MNGCWFVLQIHPLLTVYWKSSWKDGKSWKIAITLKPDILINGLELVLCLVAQLCPTLCHPMNCSPPASSVHGIFQSRILEWVALPPGGLPHPGIEPTSAVAPAFSFSSSFSLSFQNKPTINQVCYVPSSTQSWFLFKALWALTDSSSCML